VRDNLDLAVTSLGDVDLVAEVTGSALDLDLVVKELLESRKVEDLVRDWLGAVDGVLAGGQHKVHLITAHKLHIPSWSPFPSGPCLVERRRSVKKNLSLLFTTMQIAKHVVCYEDQSLNSKAVDLRVFIWSSDSCLFIFWSFVRLNLWWCCELTYRFWGDGSLGGHCIGM